MSGKSKRDADRKARRAKELDERRALQMREEFRKQNLTMWSRIEEADASSAVKEILHLMAKEMGME